MTKALIVNADDFGLAPGVNRGVVEAFEQGIVTSATVLTNMPGFADAVALARARPELPVGVHLTLLWGEPVSASGEVPGLVGTDGRFPDSLGVLLRRCLARRIRYGEVLTEFRAQVRKAVEAGLNPGHLDSHKHVHCLPVVRDAFVAVAAEFGIDRARCPFAAAGPPSPPGHGGLKLRLGCAALRFLARKTGHVMGEAGILTTDRLAGLRLVGRLEPGLLRSILEHVQEGTTELMCHPGYVDGQFRYGHLSEARETELRALCDDGVRRCVQDRSIELIGYPQLDAGR